MAIIEVLVKPGDTHQAPSKSLITVESDKASMEIPPATLAWSRNSRSLGDKVAEGSVVLTLEVAGRRRCSTCACCRRPSVRSFEQKQAPAPVPQAQLAINPASSYAGTTDLDCDVVVLGGGPGGYSAPPSARPTWA